MRGRQLRDVPEECIWCGDIAIHQVFVQRNGIDFAWNASLEDGFDFRTKDQPLAIPVVIQGFFAKAITREQETFAFSIPDGEAEHTAQALNTLITIFLVCMYDNLCVTTGTEVVPAFL